MIYVVGVNKTLGTDYQLELPEGSRIVTTHKGEAGWNYIDESEDYGYYDEDTDKDIYAVYTYEERVEVEAKNGAKRIYLIAYAWDDRDAVVSGITDKENPYLQTEISTYTTYMSLETAEGDEEVLKYENVYMIYVKGNNKELGSSYELTLPEGSKFTTVHKGEAGWRYSEESTERSDYDEESNYIGNSTYYYADRVAVKAANGAERIYLIAYAADTPETE